MIEAPEHVIQSPHGRRAPGEYWNLARRLFAWAADAPPIQDFVAAVVREVAALTRAPRVEFWLQTRAQLLRCTGRLRAGEVLDVALMHGEPDAADAIAAACRTALGGADPVVEDDYCVVLRVGTRSAPADYGVLFLQRTGEPWADDESEGLRQIALQLGLALHARRTNASLRERMKELTCLYNIALLVEQPATPHAELLQSIIEVLPDAMLQPSIAWVRLELDDDVFNAGAGAGSGPALSAQLTVGGRPRGTLAVGYREATPPLDIGPFLVEERHLVDTVAREIALILERREVAESREKLQEQLLHTERLATVGELSSGLAHELNDPLNNILGYAQLLEKETGLSTQGRQDVRTIIDSALHARQVIQQLLLFSRRMPQRRIHLNVADAVRDAGPFLQALCAKTGAQLELVLEPHLPAVSADPDQFRQILVNLVVNATQAMPQGGRITIKATSAADGGVRVTVADTGIGMSEATRARAFQPFFTTRKEGTGMGLAVVEGIVTAHDGTIAVHSAPDEGTRFDITLPVAS